MTDSVPTSVRLSIPRQFGYKYGVGLPAKEAKNVEAGDAVYIPPNAQQFIHNSGTEPLVFICLVDPAWRKEDETVYS